MSTPALPLRSMLFIPGDSEKKLAKADACGADAVIIDLEDSVAPERKDYARQLTREFLQTTPPGSRPLRYWVRPNPFDTGLTEADLSAIMPGKPDGLLQPKIDGPADVAKLSRMMDELEGGRGGARIIPVATETARAPFALGDFAGAKLPRLTGLTWGAEDLAAALGASTNRGADGEWSFTYKLCRSLALMAAYAANVQAIETLYADFRDEAGLRASSRAARAEGFTGRLAIHPAQVSPINECFTPSADEIAHAERVLAAFAANPGAGTVGLDGKMIDIPHKKQAERVIAQARAFNAG